MKGGEKEPYSVPVFGDGGVLTKRYLHDLEDSVKARTILPSADLNTVRTDSGVALSFASSVTCQILEVNVCSNGAPAVINFLAVVTGGAETIYRFDKPISYAPIRTAG